jgi:hypothetical protein
MRVLVADESGMRLLSKRLDRGTFARPAANSRVTRVEYHCRALCVVCSLLGEFIPEKPAWAIVVGWVPRSALDAGRATAGPHG